MQAYSADCFTIEIDCKNVNGVIFCCECNECFSSLACIWMRKFIGHKFRNVDVVGILYQTIDVNGEAVGGIGLHPKEDIERMNAELGYWLAEPFWGKGIITKAITQIVDFGFKTYDITRIFARPFGTNLASQRVLEKAGFKFECKFEKTLLKNGEMLDELFYSIRRKEK